MLPAALFIGSHVFCISNKKVSGVRVARCALRGTGLIDFGLNSYSSSFSTQYRIMLHKVTFFDYEDEDDDENDLIKFEA